MTTFLTCEHGGNEIPKRYRAVFDGAQPDLESHRGYDIGALDLARLLSKRLSTPLFASTTSRLLVDLNRTLSNDSLFSEYSAGLTKEERDRILARHYSPHWVRVTDFVSKQRKLSLHFGIHSFTPVLKGRRRTCEIGILFDPRRPNERHVATSLRNSLKILAPQLCVRFNYPYRGTSDGLTTALRARFPDDRYCGLELEFRQDVLVKMKNRRTLGTFADHIALSLTSAEQSLRPSDFRASHTRT